MEKEIFPTVEPSSPPNDTSEGISLTQDEYHLGQLGYKVSTSPKGRQRAPGACCSRALAPLISFESANVNKQEFYRHLGLFENWAATLTTMSKCILDMSNGNLSSGRWD